MSTKPQTADQQLLDEAKKLARTNGLFVVTRADQHLIYRRTPSRNVFVGRRTSAEGLRQRVRKLVSIPRPV